MEQLTAEALVNFFSGEGLIATSINLLAFLAGIITNVYNQMKAEDVGFIHYWKMYGKRSLASLGSLCVAFITMLFMDDSAPMYAYFTVALTTDYLINSTPKKDEVVT